MNKKLLKRNKFYDKLAHHVITIGGVAVILSVVAILFLIARVSLPLFQSPTSEIVDHRITVTEPQAVIGLDDYQENVFTIDQKGLVSVISIQGQETVPPVDLGANRDAHIIFTSRNRAEYSLLWDDGRLSVVGISFRPVFNDEGTRSIEPQITMQGEYPSLPTGSPLVQSFFTTSVDEDLPGTVRVNLHQDNSVSIFRTSITESLFGDVEESEESFVIPAYFETISALALSEDGRQLYAGTGGGTLLHWDISEAPVLEDTVPAFKQPITALGMVFGSQSLAVGTADGSLTTWMGVRDSDESTTKKLRRIHTLTSHDSPVVAIRPSRRDKSLLSWSEKGELHLDHMTSERNLYTFDLGSVGLASLNDRGKGLLALTATGVQLLKLHNPHPEVSFKSLFGKVWYENYDSPEYAWQSSSGSDDFEPKFSITPLLFGTIKGTIYAMLFALPLAIFGAVYVSQFAPPHLQQIIKPTVEVMASVPSVVIGFLIALVLAPFIETHLVALILCFLLIPLCFCGFLFFWHYAQRFKPVREMKSGLEFLLVIPVILGGVLLSYYVSPTIENLFFAGNFTQYIFENIGATYDQRNCIIIAFGLGFCVIPIIFSISEDALSNVPSGLSHASLALGASRWQTVWRVVLPSASPGIFAGSMIGLGRAVGETMIILMATGNTPIMDWSIFNGMRTLAANIAVEIPEAPVDGTLYRVLFLCSVLLFGMTFIVNTGAELIRDRLRKKYARY